MVEFINKKEFAKATLDDNIEVCVLYISFLSLRSRMTIHLIKKAQIILLLAKKITILAKYLDFADVFLKESSNVLPEQTGANKYAIQLEQGKQPPYGSLYSLGLIELKTLKIYIKTNLANGFIRILKSPASTLAFFICKPNGSFYLCVNY